MIGVGFGEKRVWNSFWLRSVMIKSILLATFALALLPAQSQTKATRASLDTLPTLAYPAYRERGFKPDEFLRFRLHYGLVDAGEATVTVSETGKTFHGRPALHMVGKGRTLGAFSWFFKVEDRYETYMDKSALFPWEFIRDIREGGYSKQQNYKFHQRKSAVTNQKGETYKMLPWSQDMISAFFYARTLDFSNAKEGDIFSIPTFVDEEEFTLRIKYIGRETISSRTGKYRCMKFVPVVQEGRIFKEEEDLVMWITDDKNKIPILIKASVLVGSIKMELVEFKNLAYPLARLD